MDAGQWWPVGSGITYHYKERELNRFSLRRENNHPPFLGGGDDNIEIKLFTAEILMTFVPIRTIYWLVPSAREKSRNL